jgi:hypothetical protein
MMKKSSPRTNKTENNKGSDPKNPSNKGKASNKYQAPKNVTKSSESNEPSSAFLNHLKEIERHYLVSAKSK